MSYETLLWLAPTLVGGAVFLAVCAIFWPKPTEAAAHEAVTGFYINPTGLTPYSLGFTPTGDNPDSPFPPGSGWNRPLGRHENPHAPIHADEDELRGHHLSE